MMEADLRAMILADAGVSAITDCVTWGGRPQGSALPAITLTRVSSRPTYVMDGPVRMHATIVQTDSWSNTTFEAAWALGEVLQSLLSGYRGEFGTTRFHGIFSEGVRDLRDAGAAVLSGDADRYFRVSIDFNINHSEV